MSSQILCLVAKLLNNLLQKVGSRRSRALYIIDSEIGRFEIASGDSKKPLSYSGDSSGV